jgi:hypothetical protein
MPNLKRFNTTVYKLHCYMQYWIWQVDVWRENNGINATVFLYGTSTALGKQSEPWQTTDQGYQRNRPSLHVFTVFTLYFAATCFSPWWPSSSGIHNYSRKLLTHNGSIVLCYRSRLLCMLENIALFFCNVCLWVVRTWTNHFVHKVSTTGYRSPK